MATFQRTTIKAYVKSKFNLSSFKKTVCKSIWENVLCMKKKKKECTNVNTVYSIKIKMIAWYYVPNNFTVQMVTIVFFFIYLWIFNTNPTEKTYWKYWNSNESIAEELSTINCQILNVSFLLHDRSWINSFYNFLVVYFYFLWKNPVLE